MDRGRCAACSCWRARRGLIARSRWLLRWRAAGAAPAPDTAATATMPDQHGRGRRSATSASGSFKAGEYNGLAEQGRVRDRQLRSARRRRLRQRQRDALAGQGHRSRARDAQPHGRSRHAGHVPRCTSATTSCGATAPTATRRRTTAPARTSLTLPGTWQVPTVPSSSGRQQPRHDAERERPGRRRSATRPTSTRRPDRRPSAGCSRRTRRSSRSSTPPPAPTCRSFLTSTSPPSGTRFDAGFAANVTPTVGASDVGVRAEHKDGMQPLGTVSRNTGGDISTIIPDLIDTDTNQVSCELSYKARPRLRCRPATTARSSPTTCRSMSWQNWATGPSRAPGTRRTR